MPNQPENPEKADQASSNPVVSPAKIPGRTQPVKRIAALEKTGAFKQIKRGKTDSYPAMKRPDRAIEHFPLAVPCVFCNKLLFVSSEYAGRLVECVGCKKRVKVPGPDFYVLDKQQGITHGPLHIAEYRTLIEQSKITADMSISTDQAVWVKISDGQQTWLMMLAQYAKHPKIRLHAAQFITDQDFLGKLVAIEKDAEVRKLAISRITNVQFLVPVLSHIEDDQLLLATLRKISDQSILADFVRNTAKQEYLQYAMDRISDEKIILELLTDMDPKVRKAAISKINDANILKSVVLEEQEEPLRKLALEQITNQNILTEIILESQDATIKFAALNKMNDQQALLALYYKTTDLAIQVAAIQRITIPTSLADILRSKAHMEIRKAAIKNLNDEALIQEIVMTDFDHDVQMEGIAKIQDPKRLQSIVQCIPDEHLREIALQRLTPELLFKIALEDESIEIRKSALRKVQQQDLLEEIYHKSTEPQIRWMAIQRISNQNLLFQIAMEDKDILLCRLAENRVILPNLLRKIMLATKDSDIKANVERKLGMKPAFMLEELGTPAGVSAQTILAQDGSTKPLTTTGDAGPYELVWKILQKIADKDKKQLFRFFAPVCLQKLTLEKDVAKVYHPETLWHHLHKLASSDKRLLARYLAPTAIEEILEQR